MAPEVEGSNPFTHPICYRFSPNYLSVLDLKFSLRNRPMFLLGTRHHSGVGSSEKNNLLFAFCFSPEF